jgi:meiotically up-regulated gene 157 (Mug157) protein
MAASLLLAPSLAAPPPVFPPRGDCASMPDARPAPSARTFTSASVDAAASSLAPRFADAALGRLFANTLPHTLDTCIARHDAASPVPDTWVITGDIAAMWLRDACAQLTPYLPFAPGDAPLRRLLAGAIARMARCVLLDPNANAFALDPDAPEAKLHADDVSTRRSANGTRERASSRGVFERKWELDSLASPLAFAESYYNATADVAPFADDEQWLQAATLAVATMREQQASSAEEDAAGGPLYTFQRLTTAPSDTLLHERGAPSRRTGLIKTAFRPSDDAAVFPFHTADNAAAAAALRALARLLTAPPVAARLDAHGGARLAADAAALAAEVEAALQAHATFTHALTGARIYSYESDGFGNHFFMDDANLPSLLGLPLLRSFCNAHNAALCTATREHALSADTNAYFFAGTVAAGIGSPHTGAGRTVWPLAVVTRAETSSNATEIQEALRMLVASSACTGLLHESFDADDATRFSRPWFAWANAAAAGLLARLARERPELVLRQP